MDFNGVTIDSVGDPMLPGAQCIGMKMEECPKFQNENEMGDPQMIDPDGVTNAPVVAPNFGWDMGGGDEG